MDQDATWYEGYPRAGQHCVKCRPISNPKGHSCPFSAHVCCGQTAGWIKMPLKFSMKVGLGQGHTVLHGDPTPRKRGTTLPPNFRSMPNGRQLLSTCRNSRQNVRLFSLFQLLAYTSAACRHTMRLRCVMITGSVGDTGATGAAGQVRNSTSSNRTTTPGPCDGPLGEQLKTQSGAHSHSQIFCSLKCTVSIACQR